MSSVSVTTTNNSKNIGRVKWFNNKSGYGFITFMNNEEYKGNDIFVHHSGIISKQNLYKYLVQGEYVEFNVEKMANKDHEIQATNITGILNGMLMCETRLLNKENIKTRYNSNEK
tara:strand:+ start:3545 stop:3889 length:345 start_codon:yes stop_codon:yes gene_type:complete